MTNTNNHNNNTTNKSNWIIIPKRVLREIAGRETDIGCLLNALEKSGGINSSLAECIIIPNDITYGEIAYVSERSVDEEMEISLYNHILTHPNNDTARNINPDEMRERIFPELQALIAGKVDDYAKHIVDLAMIMSEHAPAATAARGRNPLLSNRESTGRQSNWIVISKHKLRELAQHETDFKRLVKNIELAGDVNPGKFNYLRVKDGKDISDDLCVFTSDTMIDGEIPATARRHLAMHPNYKFLTADQLRRIEEETRGMLWHSISEIANAYAIYHAEQTMTKLPAK